MLTIDHHIDIPIDLVGDRPQGCAWQESVCTDAVTHRTVSPSGGVMGYCARHYALTLLHLVEVHLPGCRAPLSHHMTEFGELGATPHRITPSE